ncbi:ABC transporter substrate-binding protein [Rubricella aquisinus]|nr:extracellular solute-binding protein [Rubricella aquisinus]
MSDSRHKPTPKITSGPMQSYSSQTFQNGQLPQAAAESSILVTANPELLQTTRFLEDVMVEIDNTIDPNTPNPHLNMLLHLVQGHCDGRIVSPSSMVAASGVPYATGMRRLAEIQAAGLVEQRARTKSGKTFSLHPSPKLLQSFTQLAERIERIARNSFGAADPHPSQDDYYFGGSYQPGQANIPPPRVLPEPLKLSGGLRILVHGDPTFMVMENLKRQFEQIIGTDISQRAFSIDRLREEALRNAARAQSRYDLIAVDLPWVGEFVEKGVIRALPEIMDVDRLDPGDFHTAGWQAAHWNGVPYGVPSQTTPEMMFYRKDWFAAGGLEPPSTTDAVLKAAKHFHEPLKGRYGVAWNAARGTALGHTFMMTCADFGQPIFDLPKIAGGFDASRLSKGGLRPMFDTDKARDAADYLMELLQYSPPDILSMSWYERVRPFAEGKVAMAYGYTLLAPYFELDSTCQAYGNTGYLPHPHGPEGVPIAPVGGYVLCVPANLSEDRIDETVEALVSFTSPAAQKLYAQNGSRTAPRYSVGSDPSVRRLSPIFEMVDQMSWRDELQYWPRPPVPEISEVIAICGTELHDMLRGLVSPAEALKRVQANTEQILNKPVT